MTCPRQDAEDDAAGRDTTAEDAAPGSGEVAHEEVVGTAVEAPVTEQLGVTAVVVDASSRPMTRAYVLVYANVDGATYPWQTARTNAEGAFILLHPKGRPIRGLSVVVEGRPAAAVNLPADWPASPIVIVAPPALTRVGEGGAAQPSPCGPGCAGPCQDASANTSVPRQPSMSDLVEQGDAFTTDLGTGCVVVNAPDRTIENYSFQVLVRTSTPKVRVLDPTPPLLTSSNAKWSDFFELPERLSSLGGEPISVRRSDLLRLGYAEGLSDRSSLERLSRNNRAAQVVGAFMSGQATNPGQRQPEQQCEDGDHEQENGRRKIKSHPIPWDEELVLHQAVELAHGHVITYRQSWAADGYSLGTLLYSLPLAPGQSKSIAVLDWRRQDRATRTGEIAEREGLEAEWDRSRDIDEIVRAALGESVQGESKSSSSSWGAGLGAGASGTVQGFAVAGVLGVSGGASSSDSSAWQRSAREIAASTAQSVRDRISQASTFVRSRRTTTITSVEQSESVRATTEVIANQNHCHAVTMEYFEVLRHVAVRTTLADVRECLFVPLMMAPFDVSKVARWTKELRAALLDATLDPGFQSASRVDAGWPDDGPGAIAEEEVEEVWGEIIVEAAVPVPPAVAQPPAKGKAPDNVILNLLKIWGVPWDAIVEDQSLWERTGQAVTLKASPALLKVSIVVDVGSGHEKSIPADVTITEEGMLSGSARLQFRAMVGDARHQIRAIIVSAPLAPAGVLGVVPSTKFIVKRIMASYRTPAREALLVSSNRSDDVVVNSNDVAEVRTPTTPIERRDRHKEDQRAAAALIGHLNAHIEHYHHAIWQTFGPTRLHLLLDGVEFDEKRSVADVVENRVLGVVGNSLVFPVSPGVHLDPTLNTGTSQAVEGKDQTDTSFLQTLPEHTALQQTLRELYEPPDDEPLRVSIPTGGVYAESVMGSCNSCEFKDDRRLWRWEESPIVQPTPIEPIGTGSRYQASDLRADDSPTPVVSVQNIAPAPDPTGLGAAMGAVTTAGAFGDAMGLAGTQQNAAAALRESLQSAQHFGSTASSMVQQQAQLSARSVNANRMLEAVRDPNNGLNDQQRAALAQAIIREGAGLPPDTASTLQGIRAAEQRGDITSTEARALRNQAMQPTPRPTSVGDVLSHPTVRDAGQRGAPVNATARDGSVSINTASAPSTPSVGATQSPGATGPSPSTPTPNPGEETPRHDLNLRPGTPLPQGWPAALEPALLDAISTHNEWGFESAYYWYCDVGPLRRHTTDPAQLSLAGTAVILNNIFEEDVAASVLRAQSAASASRSHPVVPVTPSSDGLVAIDYPALTQFYDRRGRVTATGQEQWLQVLFGEYLRRALIGAMEHARHASTDTLASAASQVLGLDPVGVARHLALVGDRDRPPLQAFAAAFSSTVTLQNDQHLRLAFQWPIHYPGLTDADARAFLVMAAGMWPSPEGRSPVLLEGEQRVRFVAENFSMESYVEIQLGPAPLLRLRGGHGVTGQNRQFYRVICADATRVVYENDQRQIFTATPTAFQSEMQGATWRAASDLALAGVRGTVLAVREFVEFAGKVIPWLQPVGQVFKAWDYVQALAIVVDRQADIRNDVAAIADGYTWIENTPGRYAGLTEKIFLAAIERARLSNSLVRVQAKSDLTEYFEAMAELARDIEKAQRSANVLKDAAAAVLRAIKSVTNVDTGLDVSPTGIERLMREATPHTGGPAAADLASILQRGSPTEHRELVRRLEVMTLSWSRLADVWQQMFPNPVE